MKLHTMCQHNNNALQEKLQKELQELEHAFAEALNDEEPTQFLSFLWKRILEIRSLLKHPAP